LEELLLEENPLKARPRKHKGEKSPIPPFETPEQRGIRLMEDEFENYDFSKVKKNPDILDPGRETYDLCERGNHVVMDKVSKPGESAVSNSTSAVSNPSPMAPTNSAANRMKMP
jgi:hypothetical protein